MALKGLAVLVGKGKEGEEDDSPTSPSLEDEHLTDAFDAANKGDRRDFVTAMKAAIRACMASEEDGEYDDKDQPEVVGQGAL